MSPPELPADKPLECGVALVHQGAPAAPAERQRLPELERLPVVEDVALPVVGGRAAGRLVPELRAPLDGQRLVGVHEGLADGQLAGARRLEVHAHEGARHGRVAGQEERLALFEEAGEAVADGIRAQVWTVVADTNHNRGWFVGA